MRIALVVFYGFFIWKLFSNLTGLDSNVLMYAGTEEPLYLALLIQSVVYSLIFALLTASTGIILFLMPESKPITAVKDENRV